MKYLYCDLGEQQQDSTARLQVPEDGHWYLVIDCGGHQHRVHAEKIEILTAESPTPSEADTKVVGAAA